MKRVDERTVRCAELDEGGRGSVDGALGARSGGQVDTADDTRCDPDGRLLQVPEDLVLPGYSFTGSG